MATQKGIENWKAKKWFTVYAPKVFGDMAIGEMPGKDEKAVMGRNIVISMDSLTHNPQNANVNLVLKVSGVEGDKAVTKLVTLELLFSFIRTLVRRYKSVSMAVVRERSKDGVEVAVKPLIVTIQRSTASRLDGIRAEMVEFLKGYVKENDAESIVKAVVEGQLQQEMHSKLMHIAPISKAEVRKLELGW